MTGSLPFSDLPQSVVSTEVDGRQVFLVGTAHVSAASVEDVARTLQLIDPDAVCVELCEARYRNLTDSESWRQLDIFQVLRQGRAALLLSSLVMTSFQRRIAKRLGVTPGAEMLAAIRWAEASEKTLCLVDRDIQVTLKRTWARLGLWTRLKMLFQLVASIFVAADVEESTIEQLKEEAQLESLLESLATSFPSVKTTLIDERDTYLAEKIRRTPGGRIVAVVGAGHVQGILRRITNPTDLAPLEEVPPPSLMPRVFKWLIPLAIVALIAWGFFRGGAEESVTSIYVWLLVNGSLAAVGTVAALGHPLTVLSAFLAAPLTSLNPFIAAGWVAGLVQAWVKQPTVADLEDLPEDITSVRGFWHNPVSRILLVVALANLGSMIGTFVAASWIAARVF